MSSQQINQALSEGTQLLNYRIAKQLAGGGFSLVYLAYDETGTPVAIKEYLPSGLALRDGGELVQATSVDNLNTFRYGMKCFFEEGRALAKIAHPNVVRVTNFFRANETVYMVMQYERGRTMQEHIQQNKGQIRESFIRRVFAQMLNGLREVHTHKLLHLDIKPANIYLRLDGSPVLLDFGAARQTLSSEKNKLSPMYTPGFAAPEQYKNRERLGPWTDIYSVGASMFACMAGFAPQAADARMEDDKMTSATKLWPGDYSEQLLQLIDQCLELDYMKRPQSVFALQKELVKDVVPEELPPKKSLISSIRATLNRDLF
ncbi:MAG: serine/threonine-protein kinase [Pseudomonadota bacterium]|nr:serine/threonine protein kinase [Gammaproteobacteria bacterium]MBU1731660.1 serine/threonine protein kinase [Gammaproteobacteria bacterium]MBU1892682.1 serine/threonine protein kinase [Gammaproteobacteria bacterium]